MAMKQMPRRVAISSSVPIVRIQPNPIMDQGDTSAQAVIGLSHPTLYYLSGQSMDMSTEGGRKCPGISNSAYYGFQEI